MYKQDLALNNQRIVDMLYTQPNQTKQEKLKSNQF